MRFLIATLFLCLAPPAQAEGTGQFTGPRYQVAYAWDVAQAIQKQRAKTPGKARQRKQRRQIVPVPIPRPGTVAPLTLAQGAAREARRAFGQPAFVRGRLICAINVGRALQARGIRGTGSALAKSYLAWGRASGPVPGAVAVFSRGRRGGHVAIVHAVLPNGTVVYLNPSSRRQAWVIGPYRRKPISYRVAA